MLISHEAPLSIMPLVKHHTDYDYCLVHLLEESVPYKNFFLDSKKEGRKIILDCSLYELGYAFDTIKYIAWIHKLNPSDYIIPDVFQNFSENLKSFEKFMSIHNPFEVTGKTIGVIQGKTYKELCDSYRFMSENADKIAISFGYDYYVKQTGEQYKPLAYSKGRQNLINRLIDDGVINYNKQHHLLGCGLPTEFTMYKRDKMRYSFIESIDTSHPVVNGYFSELYEEGHTNTKRTEKMVDIFDREIFDFQIENIIKNINYFKKHILS
jgi:hypothetical protein